jgi:hypothetical protein
MICYRNYYPERLNGAVPLIRGYAEQVGKYISPYPSAFFYVHCICSMPKSRGEFTSIVESLLGGADGTRGDRNHVLLPPNIKPPGIFDPLFNVFSNVLQKYDVFTLAPKPQLLCGILKCNTNQ